MNDHNETNAKAEKCYYFGYGSNIHPYRLKEEDRAPSACFVGISKCTGYALMFNKESIDGSGKGNIVKTKLTSDWIYGAVYEIHTDDKKQLSKKEGSGYTEKSITVICQGEKYCCFTYEAKKQTDNLCPYHWYKEMIVLGAEYVEFPNEYIATIKAVESKPDPCTDSREKNEELISKMRDYNGDCCHNTKVEPTSL